MIGTVLDNREGVFRRKDGTDGVKQTVLLRCGNDPYPFKVDATRDDERAYLVAHAEVGKVVSIPLRFVWMRDGRSFLTVRLP